MSLRVVEFWFEFASTYSHVAAHRIEALASAADVTIRWRPFLLGPIFKAQGWDTSPFNIYEAKGAYMWRDMARVCEAHHVPFRKPSVFPRNGLLPARVATAAASEPFLPEFVRATYRANFHDDAWLERASSTETKEALRARSNEAMSRGIFGAPSLFVGTELFWGNDRVEDAIDWCRRDSHEP